MPQSSFPPTAPAACPTLVQLYKAVFPVSLVLNWSFGYFDYWLWATKNQKEMRRERESMGKEWVKRGRAGASNLK